MKTMRVAIITVCMICVCIGWSLNVAAKDIQENPNIEIDFDHEPAQSVCGKSREIIVVGKGFSAISSVEITPAEHIDIKEIQKIDTKKWSFMVVTEKNAQPGERTIVWITPEGLRPLQ